MSICDIYFHRLVRELRQKGISFEKGLDDDEIAQAEGQHNFKFPPDLRDLLQFSLPTSHGFPNWRVPLGLGDKDGPSIRERMDWPSVGIRFDIERNNFWPESWGARPPDIRDALNVATEEVRHAPRLVPVYSHRYLPSEPIERGNPVFSVYQTDVIYYGNDLPSYFAREFGVSCPSWAAKHPKPIPFWSALAVD